MGYNELVKIKIRPIERRCEKLSRELNKLLHNNRCERCGKSGDVYKLDWSHVISREVKCLKYDPDNWMLLCFQCHKWWHDWPTRSAEWFENKYPGRKKRLHDKENKKKTIHAEDYLKIEAQLKELNTNRYQSLDIFPARTPTLAQNSHIDQPYIPGTSAIAH